MAERAEPTRDQIAQDYATALKLIDDLKTSNLELLAALKGLLAPEPGGVYATNDVIDAARAAVRKAEGR